MTFAPRLTARLPFKISFSGRIGGCQFTELLALGETRNVSIFGLRGLINAPVNWKVNQEILITFVIPTEPTGPKAENPNFTSESDASIELNLKVSIVWKKGREFGMKIVSTDTQDWAIYRNLVLAAEEKQKAKEAVIRHPRFA